MLPGEDDTSMMRTWRYNLTLVTVSTDGVAYAHLTLAVTFERAARRHSRAPSPGAPRRLAASMAHCVARAARHSVFGASSFGNDKLELSSETVQCPAGTSVRRDRIARSNHRKSSTLMVVSPPLEDSGVARDPQEDELVGKGA